MIYFGKKCDQTYDPMGYGYEEGYLKAQIYVGQDFPEHPQSAASINSVIEQIKNLGGVIKDGVVIVTTGLGTALGIAIGILAKAIGLDVQPGGI